MSGYTYSYRSKWEHPIFRDLQEAAVWAWICDSAVWKDTRINYCGIMVELSRGQLITSRSFISKGFNLGEQRVRSLLARMEQDGMINQLPTSHGTIITICNYEKYQPSQPATNQVDNQPLTSHQPATNQNKKESNKLKEDNKEIESNARAKEQPFDLPDWIPRQDWDDWVQQRKKKPTLRAKQLAVIELEKLRLGGNDPGGVLRQSIMNGWLGLFPIKNNHQNGGKRDERNKSERLDDAAREAVAEILAAKQSARTE